jgi:eukaryotic-like serine/threonine-protein kinase
LQEIVGSGAMGVVWKAQDERLGRTVAIKQLLVRYGLSDSQTKETRRRAMREARIAARLQHRNAIAMYDVAEHEGDPCLVMEFLPSRSLSAVLEEKGSLPPEEVAEIGAQAAAALAAAHAVGIAHRDVKPGNILLADNGTVKITDFGISRALDDGTVTTQTGMLAGTPAYLAPEIARGDDPTRASDVFSLGSTLYHAVEGRPPFGTNNGNPLALLHQVASGNVPQPKKAGPLTPALLSLMQVDPKTRPTMSDAVKALAEPASVRMPTVAAALAAPAPPTPSPAPTMAALPPAPKPQRSGQPKRTAVLMSLIAVLALAVVAIAVIALNQDDQQPGANQNPETITETVSNEPPPSSSPDTSEADGPIPADGPIGYSDAGTLVIAYYGDPANADARWAMLSPNAQAAFGGRQAFDEYWAKFTDVSSEDANGVTPNADGSVNVPVLVTYTDASGPRQERLHIRVTRYHGQLLIDSEAK